MDGPVDWWWKMSLLDVCVQAGFCQIRSHFFLTFPDVVGGSDCGLYALAFAYTMCSGTDPAKISYKQDEFRPHFLQCLHKKAIEGFPQEDVMKNPGKAMLCRVNNIFCICRLPDAGDNVIKCSNCSTIFHCACVNVAKDIVSYMWLCASCDKSDIDGNL